VAGTSKMDVSTPKFADVALPRSVRRARAWCRKEFEIVGGIGRGMLRWRHSILPTSSLLFSESRNPHPPHQRVPVIYTESSIQGCPKESSAVKAEGNQVNGIWGVG
jgi:hypothetical protein